jgi:hypothetical protein
MKRSKEIVLTIVVASVFTACSNNEKHHTKSRFHVRADTTNEHYTTQRNYGSRWHSSYHGMHFAPSGIFNNGTYQRSGYYNSKTYHSSTYHSTSHVTTGGFGSTGRSGGFHVSS